MNFAIPKAVAIVGSLIAVAILAYVWQDAQRQPQRPEDDATLLAAARKSTQVIAKVETTDGTSAMKQDASSLVDIGIFLGLPNASPRQFQRALREIGSNWDISYVPIILETGRFLGRRQQAQAFALMESYTGKEFGFDFDEWMRWNWKQEYDPHPQYGQFKAAIYRKIDERFAEYFKETRDAAIRLDEIRWGGVKRDGIPPLKNPKMLGARHARYLSDSDVVFGVKLNGDARCYPKRILAWHEMFKDTIGGEPVCGVY